TISGTPETALVVGNPWSFRPTASDPDGDKLTFSIQGKPEWAAFDSRTGKVSGTPTTKGSHSDITITASDGTAKASLKPFALQVDEPTLGTATVSWEPPTTRTDGSTLTDLAGYRVYYGKDAASLTHMVEVPEPGQTSYHVENLDAGTWYFAVTALSSEGLESPKSEIGSKEVM
ncbi:MAG: fibronectin type III domain-containing protein, partial [Pirellulaceae bacterium]